MNTTHTLPAAILIALTTCGTTPVHAGGSDTTGVKGETSGNTSSGIDPRARDLISRVGTWYRSIEAGTVDVRVAIRSTPPDGDVLRFNADSTFAFARPNRFAFRPRNDTDGGTVTCDGRLLTCSLPILNQYCEHPAPSAFATAMQRVPDIVAVSTAGGLEIDVLLGLLSSDPESRMLESTTQLRYLGDDVVDGIDAHHVVFANDGIDVHMWVQQGDAPWLLQLTPDFESSARPSDDDLDTTNVPTPKLDITVSYRRWSSAQTSNAGTFAFAAPDGAERVSSLLGTLTAGDPTPTPDQRSGPTSSKINTIAPDMALDLLDGGTMRLSDHRGRDVVILDFWTTWCVPCRQTMSTLARLERTFADQDVVLYMVNLSERDEVVQKFMQRTAFSFKVAMDRSGTAARAFEVAALPHTIILDRAGNVVATHTGVRPGYEEDLRRDIERAASRTVGVTDP